MTYLVNLSYAALSFVGQPGGNTTFVGTIGGPSPTVRTIDTITGQGGGNVFDLNDFGVSNIPAIHVSGVQTLNITSDTEFSFNDQTWSGLKSISIDSSSDVATVITHSPSIAVSSPNTGLLLDVIGGSQTQSVSVTGGIYNEISDSSPNTLQNISINNTGVMGQYSYTTINSTDLTNLNINNETEGVYVANQSASPLLNLTLDGDGPGYVGSTGSWFEDNTVQLLKVFTVGVPSSIYIQTNNANRIDFVDITNISLSELIAQNAKLVTILGNGSFSANFQNVNTAAAVNASGSVGAISVILNSSGQQTFQGGFGQDTVTIGGNQTGQVLGSKSLSNEIILNNAIGASDANLSSVKGFTELGVEGNTSGTFDLQKAALSAVDIQGAGGALNFTNTPNATEISVENSDNYSISVTRASSLTMELGTAATNGVSLSGLNLSGTVSLTLVSNGTGINTLAALTGNSLSQINLSGGAGLNLTSLPANGLQISGASDEADNTITLGDGANAAGKHDAITLGNGDNTITLGTPGGGGGGSTHLITLGNGDNTVIDYGTGSTTIHVGAGSNAITTAAGVVGAISLGAHSGADAITLGASGTSTTAIVSITGLNNAGSDTIHFADQASVATGHIVNVNATDVIDAGENANLLSNWIATVLGYHNVVAQTAHGIFDFQFQGDTYLVETAAATDNGVLSSFDTVVKLTGTGYSFEDSNASDGILHLFG